MARARNDIHVRISKPFSSLSDGSDATFVKGGRVELAHDLAFELNPDVFAKLWRAGHELMNHPVQLIEKMGPHIDGKDHLAGDHVARVWR